MSKHHPSLLAIDTGDPDHDAHPLKVPDQPEKRRSRRCFWDEPKVWAADVELTFGG